MGKTLIMYICQFCKKVPATIHLTDIQNNVKKEIHMCEGCATAKGFSIQAAANIPHLLGLAAKKKAGFHPQEKDAVCDACGWKWSDFRSKGRFGCSSDYQAFRDKIEPLLAGIHGHEVTHAGKRPGQDRKSVTVRRELVQTERLLQQAVGEERYEEAAKLRDKAAGLRARLGAE